MPRIVAYLLLTWTGSRPWLIDALQAAAYGSARTTIRVGDGTVRVQCLRPVDLEDTYATIVITNKTSLSEWDWGGRC